MMDRIRNSPRFLALLLVLTVAALAISIRFAPRRPGPEWQWYDRAVQAASHHRYAEAITDCERSLRHNPGFTAPYDLLASVYVASGRSAEALQALDQLRGLRPSDAYVSTRIAEVYSVVDNVFLTRWARVAILQDPQSPRAHMLLALGLVRSGYPRDGIYHAEIAESLVHSHMLADILKGNPAIRTQPEQLVRTLHALMPYTPYNS